KYWLGLHNQKPVVISGILDDLHSHSADLLNRRLAEESITVQENFPLRPGKTAALALLAQPEQAESALIHHGFRRWGEIADGMTENTFHQRLSQNGVATYVAGNALSESEREQVVQQLVGYDHIIISLHQMQLKAVRGFGITEDMIKLINQLAETRKATLVIFGSAYAVRKFRSAEDFHKIVFAYQETTYTLEATAAVVVNHARSKGQIPVMIKHNSDT
ncbi:MAG: hypothetical protein R3C61_25425, partial [Bacteroidia bacterium]